MTLSWIKLQIKDKIYVLSVIKKNQKEKKKNDDGLTTQ